MKTTVLQKVKGVLQSPFTVQTFDVNDTFRWLKVEFEKSAKGWSELLLFDPNGVVRAQALVLTEKGELIISDQEITSSFSTVSGPIQAGRWRLEIFSQKEIEFHCRLELGMDDLVHAHPFEIDIFTTSNEKPSFELAGWNPELKVQTESKWYKGDFHTHTNLSDGKLTVDEGMESARNMGLDFFVATDHNILPTKWMKSDILVIPGIEITSSKGHFNAHGIRKWVDWRPSCEDGGMETEKGMNRILKEVKQAGGVRSINHPQLKPWEWQFKETLLKEIDVIEIWNDPTFKDNPKATEEALVLWDTLLNDGYRIAGIGGSDSHMRPTDLYPGATVPSLIGDPATYVWAEGLSGSSILEGIKRGHVYVTRFIDLKVDVKSNDSLILLGSEVEGDVVVDYTLKMEKTTEECEVIWIQNGEVIQKDLILPNSPYNFRASFEDSEFQWIRFELRRKDGELLAFSNPIYKGCKTPTLTTWGELLAKSGVEVIED